jgi:hypothetical protein
MSATALSGRNAKDDDGLAEPAVTDRATLTARYLHEVGPAGRDSGRSEITMTPEQLGGG